MTDQLQERLATIKDNFIDLGPKNSWRDEDKELRDLVFKNKIDGTYTDHKYSSSHYAEKFKSCINGVTYNVLVERYY